MKISLLSISFFFLVISSGFCQTKMISHKSHSGSSKTFSRALKNNLFNMGESNFGMAPQRMIRNSNLDTVKLLSPHVAVMFTSESCQWEDYEGDNRSSSELWSAGIDTVFDHPVFNSKNTLTEIKSKLKSEYYFSNSIDSVVFIGFEGNYAIATPKTSAPIKVNPHAISEIENETNNGTNNGKKPSIFMIIILSLFSSIFRMPF